jgi:hypothetical protein
MPLEGAVDCASGVIPAYCENHTEHINTLPEENDFFNVTPGGNICYHYF